MKIPLSLLSIITLCCGCDTVKLFSTLGPQEPEFLRIYRTNAETRLADPTNYARLLSLPKAERNDYINDGISVIDHGFNEFLQKMGVQISGLDTLSDMAILGTQLAAAGVPGASTKTIFSLIGSGLTGTRIAAEKNYFAQKSAAAVYAKMLAYRSELRVAIERRKEEDSTAYPLSEAIGDLRDYHAAGSLIMTTTRMSSEAGASLIKSEADLKNLTTGKRSASHATAPK
jgi:hypothetical protein